jgi:hypothetical protein
MLSTDLHLGSNRGDFSSVVPSDSPGGFTHTYASTSGMGEACGRGPSPAPLTLHQLLQERRTTLPSLAVSMMNCLPVIPSLASAAVRWVMYVRSSGQGSDGPSFLPSWPLTVF